MRRTVATLLIAFLLPACSSEPAGKLGTPVSGPGAPDAADQVEQTFQDYKDAALARDGDRVAELVTDSTLEYYEELVELAKNADRPTLREESLADQYAVLLFRALAAPEAIAGMTAKDAIAFAIDEGLIGEDAVRRLEIGTVAIFDRSATAEVASPPDAAGRFKFEFEYDGGRWRIDIVALLDLANLFIRSAYERSKLTEEQFLAVLVESSTGKRFTDSLWIPTRELKS